MKDGKNEKSVGLKNIYVKTDLEKAMDDLFESQMRGE